MISLEKLMILTPLQKLPNDVINLGKIIVASLWMVAKVQKIAQSGHTGHAIWQGAWDYATQQLLLIKYFQGLLSDKIQEKHLLIFTVNLMDDPKQ